MPPVPIDQHSRPNRWGRRSYSTSAAPPALTHVDERGSARMVAVSSKPETHRTATATCRVLLNPLARALVLSDGRERKGDVLATARIAGIMAAKRTSELIPLCHPIILDHVAVNLVLGDDGVDIEARVECVGRTGVEMEAMTAAAVAGLTVYDMVKAVDRAASVTSVKVTSKTGGKSDWAASN